MSQIYKYLAFGNLYYLALRLGRGSQQLIESVSSIFGIPFLGFKSFYFLVQTQ